MQKIKLHEATKQFGISNKLAMFYLEKNDISVKSHSSVVSMEQLEILREFAENKNKYTKIIKEFENKTKRKKVKSQPEVAKKKEQKKIEPVKKIEKPLKESPALKEEKLAPVVKPPEEKTTKKKEEPAIPAEQPEKSRPVDEIKVKKVIPEKKETKEKIEAKKIQAAPPEPRLPKREIIKKEAVKVTKTKIKSKKFDVPKLIQIPDFITLRELADKLNIRLKDIEERMELFHSENIRNQILEQSDVEKICKEFNVDVDIIHYEDFLFNNSIEESKADLIKKTPVVTVMGHVDHGKTTLLDTLRNTSVAEGEAGGITQKIGAYKLNTKHGNIIFIDTPGHEAFTNMRLRGARNTDIVILIIAANDGVMPQTVEAINHARSADVPIIVAINKIDVKGADSAKVKQELTKHNVLVEEWGGEVVSVEISAKLDKNLASLLEMISLVSEMQELKHYHAVPARGSVIEAKLDVRMGPVATVLLEHGNLKRGDFFICGNSVGKVKTIFNDEKKTLNSALAPIPVEIMGFEEVPRAGELFQVVDDIEKAKRITELRKIREKRQKGDEIFEEKKLSLQNLFENVEKEDITIFSIIVKSDDYGSGEVIENILKKQENEKLQINVVHKGIGNITESDVLLASTSNSIIIGFNIKTPKKVLSLAKREKVEIKLYSVIYHLSEDIEKAVKGEMKPEYKKELIGKVEVLKLFKISKKGTIAGCVVREGRVTKKSEINVLREDDIIFTGEIETLRRIKDEVSEVKAGVECGIKVKNFNKLMAGDIFEVFEMVIKQ